MIANRNPSSSFEICCQLPLNSLNHSIEIVNELQFVYICQTQDLRIEYKKPLGIPYLECCIVSVLLFTPEAPGRWLRPGEILDPYYLLQPCEHEDAAAETSKNRRCLSWRHTILGGDPPPYPILQWARKVQKHATLHTQRDARCLRASPQPTQPETWNLNHRL